MPPVSGLVPKNPANATQGKHNHNYSTFDKSLSYRFYNTVRFAEYTPTWVFEGVPKDVVTLNSSDKIDSLSLNAPFKGTIRKIKESFMVPNMAILPLQWDKIYSQPTVGDDVPQDCNCVIDDFPELAKKIFTSAVAQVAGSVPSGTTPDLANFLRCLFKALTLGEYFYSTGSLMNVLGYKMSAQYNFLYQQTASTPFGYSVTQKNYDEFYDLAIYAFLQDIVYFEFTTSTGKSGRVRGLSPVEPPVGDGYISLREFLDIVRDGNDFSLSNVLDLYNNDYTSFFFYVSQFFTVSLHRFITVYDGTTDDITTLNAKQFNASRLLAYQLICAHFYTNSNVDFMYSAELYRQYLYDAMRQYFSAYYVPAPTSFTCNGTQLQYDYLSGHYLSLVMDIPHYSSSWLDDFTAAPWFAVMSAIFAFRKSLRFGDYFTGSRTRPLAPINTDVSVNLNLVSVIDITRNIQAQRFANSVMRSGRKIEEYVASLFGKSPQPDFHNPFYLTQQIETIFGDSVQNTGDAQTTDPNSRTANFASRMSNHTFTFHNDDMHPCIYMQIIYFDVRRAYSRTVDRQFLHVDRFDMFNPDFQYIGDQPVYGIELGYPDFSISTMPNIFGYQGRDMEYKQSFDKCSSGFASGALPGWAFTDSNLPYSNVSVLDSDFIRSRNSDIDNLYLSLTGYSNGTYFHFISITDNLVSAKRPMAIDPQILA